MTMTSWTDLVLDAAPLKAIFGPKPPSLESINVHEVVLHRDGPRVLLRFDLHDFPMHPPKKWSAAGFNRVQIRLLALGVQQLQIAGLQSDIQVDLCIDKDGPLIRLQADNNAVRLYLETDFLIVEGINAYKEESSN